MRRRSAWVLGLFLARSVGAQDWVPSELVPSGRDYSSLVYDIARGRLVLFGGDGYQGVRADTWEFDGLRWTAGSAAPPGLRARGHHAAAYDERRRVVVLYGGLAVNPVDDVWEYDGLAWVARGSGPAPIRDHAMAFDAARAVVVVHGGETPGPTAQTWEYDGSAWRPGAAAPRARTSHAMAFDRSRARIVAFGGWNGQGLLNDTWEYDGAWSPGAAAPPGLEPRAESAMAYDEGRRRIVLAGGFGGPGPPRVEFPETWEYDGTSWIQSVDMPGPSWSAHDVAYHPVSGVTLYGGASSRDGTWGYDGSSWHSAEPSPGFLPRDRAACAFDASRFRVVLFGGFWLLEAILQNDTWELDGERWIRGASPPPSLTPRAGAAMAFHASAGRCVMFGGETDSTAVDETWTYDGSWAPGPAPPAGMQARFDHGFAHDSVRGRSVLFGGFDASRSPLGDTWEYDGAAWSAGAAAPAQLVPRSGHSMTYDARRACIVLFGGEDDGAEVLGDVWELDGAGWRPGLPAPAGLVPRSLHGLAFDSRASEVILFGGFDGTSELDDTWRYDGTTWIAGPLAPPALTPRYGPILVEDGTRGRVVLFGGSDPAGRRDTWELALVPRARYVAAPGLAEPEPDRVRVFEETGAPTTVEIVPYGAGKWGANVAWGHVDGDAKGDILTGPGPGSVYGPNVKAFRGSGTAVAKVSFYAYGTLRFGANVASADVDGDGFAEILTGAGPGEPFGPHVRGWNYDGAALSAIGGINFFAYQTLRYGTNVAGGDVDADGNGETLTAPGPGVIFAPLVRGFDHDGGGTTAIAKINFWAFPELEHGAHVASAEVDGDAAAEIVAAPGPGPLLLARFRGYTYDGAAVDALPGYDATPFATSYGGRVGLGDVAGDARAELAACAGRDPAAAAYVQLLSYDGAALWWVDGFTAFPGLAHGASATAGEIDLSP